MLLHDPVATPDTDMTTPQPMTLVVIEDDDVDAEALERAIRREGMEFPILRTTTAEAALALLKGERGMHPLTGDILFIVDLNLPGSDGHEFLRHLQLEKTERQCNPVALVLTTSEDPRDRELAFSQNVAGFVRKSVAGDTYREVIAVIRGFQRVIGAGQGRFDS